MEEPTVCRVFYISPCPWGEKTSLLLLLWQTGIQTTSKHRGNAIPNWIFFFSLPLPSDLPTIRISPAPIILFGERVRFQRFFCVGEVRSLVSGKKVFSSLLKYSVLWFQNTSPFCHWIFQMGQLNSNSPLKLQQQEGGKQECVPCSHVGRSRRSRSYFDAPTERFLLSIEDSMGGREKTRDTPTNTAPPPLLLPHRKEREIETKKAGILWEMFFFREGLPPPRLHGWSWQGGARKCNSKLLQNAKKNNNGRADFHTCYRPQPESQIFFRSWQKQKGEFVRVRVGIRSPIWPKLDFPSFCAVKAFSFLKNKNRLCSMTCGLEENCKNVHEVQNIMLGIPLQTEITLPRSELKKFKQILNSFLLVQTSLRGGISISSPHHPNNSNRSRTWRLRRR